MICDECQQDVDQISRCGCGLAVCFGCVPWHACGQEGRAQFTGGGDSPQTRDPVELSNSLMKLRPYQRDAFAAIVEALR